MDVRRIVSPMGALVFVLLVGLLIGAIYWGVNAYLFTSGTNSNGIAVAASAAFASLFLVGAIFVMVAHGISIMNTHLEHIEAAANEQVRLLRYLAKQSKQSNAKQDLLDENF